MEPIHKVKPDNTSYSSLINALAEDGQSRAACALLKEMTDCSGLAPNVVAFGTAIKACARGGDWRQALDILDGMPAVGVQPNIIAVNTALAACARAGRAAEAIG
ncbi:unnamed protein product, partial [Phaeothamnion confervicola]